jgi:addiction module RelB/DinJ family antitoxin
MLSSNSILIQVDPTAKAQAEPVLAAIGLSFSDVFNLLLQQISLKQRIPFDLSAIQLTENGFTSEFEANIIAEANEMHTSVANGTAKLYNNALELFADMDMEDDKSD